ncbi:hypothetical protein CDV31_006495 [Fusarium ambrosium]|uniref:Uncharacterized protein n=1 Tax=Fusarium ambrosium TaxID=131363 RepID=A0A428UCL8_9HYPO|nr:hypothetical protein CDV31_006495 [Fusarium ambrosium]
MRFARSLLLGLLVGHGLAQTAVEPVEEQASAVAPQNPSEPAAEESAAAPVAEPTQDNSSPEPTADTEEPAESAAAPPGIGPSAEEEPTAGVTATNDNSEATEVPEASGTGTAEEEASATADPDDSTTATGEATGTATEEETGATKTESSVPTATSVTVKADLKNATVSENAEIVEVEGKPAVKLSAPVDGEATFSVSVDTDDDFDAGEMIHIVASIFVGEPSGSNSAKLRRRGRKTDCNLQMKLNGQTVYDEPLQTTDGKWQDVSSTGLQSSDPQPKIDVTQKCGKTPAPLTVNNVQVANENLGSSSGGSGSGGSGSGSGSGSSSGSGSGSGSGSDSESGSDSSSSDDDDSAGSKAATSMVGLIAAMAAAMLFM